MEGERPQAFSSPLVIKGPPKELGQQWKPPFLGPQHPSITLPCPPCTLHRATDS